MITLKILTMCILRGFFFFATNNIYLGYDIWYSFDICVAHLRGSPYLVQCVLFKLVLSFVLYFQIARHCAGAREL